MSEQNQITTTQPRRASHVLAALTGMEPSAMLDTIKAQCFKGSPANISDAQLAAFVSIAAEMGVNPLLPGMMYAYPTSGGGIVPMMGPDATFKKLMEHPEVDSWETEVLPADVALPPTHAITRIYRKGRERPLTYTALLSEWRVEANPNWRSRSRHMLGLRSLKQCARQIIHGIPFDEDERVIMGAIDVTPETEKAARPAPPARSPKGAAAVKSNPPPAPEVVVEAEVVTPVAEAPKVAPVTVAPEPAPTPEKPVQSFADAAAATAGPRTALEKDETITIAATVTSIKCLSITKGGVETSGVQAVVKSPEFEGEVFHKTGSTLLANGTRTENPPWVIGGSIVLKLRGEHSPKKNRVIAWVEEAAAAIPQADGDV